MLHAFIYDAMYGQPGSRRGRHAVLEAARDLVDARHNRVRIASVGRIHVSLPVRNSLRDHFSREDVVHKVAPGDFEEAAVEGVGQAAVISLHDVVQLLLGEGVVLEGDAQGALEEPLRDRAKAGSARVLEGAQLRSMSMPSDFASRRAA